MVKTLALGLLTLSASAFAQTCRVDMVDNYSQRIIQTFRAYGDQTCLEGMKQCRKEIRLRGLLNRADCLRAGSSVPGPGPIPGPNPGPIPTPNPNPYPQPGYGVSVTGLIEDSLFRFAANNPAELYLSCLTDIRAVRMGSADEIFFTVNSNRFISASTSGWYNDTQICSILEQEARQSYGQGYSTPLRIVGSIERAPFQIDAFDRASLLEGCIGSFRATRQGSVDEISYSVNGGPFQRITTSGWWTTPERACRAMLGHMDNMLP